VIEPGDGWKFREKLADWNLFEDQAVEHILTGHIAARRVFIERLTADKTAIDALNKQMFLAARADHPALPRIYHAEIVKGHACIYTERVHGETLEAMARKAPYSAPERWAARALSIARICRDFQALGVGFDRLRLADLVASGTVTRVARWSPIANPTLEETGSSPYFSRLLEAGCGGVYVANTGQDYPLAAGLARLKDLFFFMATGQVERDVARAIAAANQEGGRRLSVLGVEPPIADIIMRLHQPNGDNGIRDLETLETALQRVSPVMNVSRVVAKPAPVAPARPYAIPPSDDSVPLPPLHDAIPSSGEVPLPPREKARPLASPVEAPKAIETDMKSKESLERDASEDRSYLYPQKQGSSASSSRTSVGVGVDAQSFGAAAPRRDLSGIFRAVAIALVLVVLAGGAAYAVVAFMASRENKPPVAVMAELAESYAVGEKIALDGTASTDPEAATLSYHWSVPGLDQSNLYWARNNSRDAARTELQIFQSGEYPVRLRVFDGAGFSPDIERTILIRTASR